VKDATPGAGQRGVVLVVTLLVLLLLGLIATTVGRTNQLELHMAGNDEARIAALQQGLGAVDAVLASATNTPLRGGVGYRVCIPDSPDATCDEHTLVVAPGAQPAVGTLDVAVTRLAPLEDRIPVMAEGRASSTVYYRLAKFEVQVTYDATGQDLGRVALAQGVLVRLSTTPQSGGGDP